MQHCLVCNKPFSNLKRKYCGDKCRKKASNLKWQEYHTEWNRKKRAKEATKGVIDSIKWLDKMDSVIVVLDGTQDPYSQVNVTIIGNLQARDIPVLIIANKVDLKKANMDAIQSAFPQYKVIGISAKYGKNIEDFYEELFKFAK